MTKSYNGTVRVLFFFFKQKTAYEMRISDWSSDVCSSDLEGDARVRDEDRPRVAEVLPHRRVHRDADAPPRVGLVLAISRVVTQPGADDQGIVSVGGGKEDRKSVV